MRCSNCGTENQDDAAFCRACGHLLTTPAAAIAAAHNISGATAVAAVDAIADSPRCRHCQAPLAPGARFCGRCGQLTAAPAVPIETLARNYPPPPSARRGGGLLFGAALAAAVVLGIYWNQEHAAPPLLAGEPPLPPAVVAPAGTPAPPGAPAAELPPPRPGAASQPAEPVPAHPAPTRKAGKTVHRSPAPAEPPTTAVAPAAPAAEPPPARPALPVWYAGLKAELRRCDIDSHNFFSRTYCKEKAKFHFCGPDHWGQVPECVKTATKADY